MTTGLATTPVEIDWHVSDRYLGAEATGVTTRDSADATATALPLRPHIRLRQDILSGQFIGWTYRSLRNRLRVTGGRLVRAAVHGNKVGRVVHRDSPLVARAYALVTGRRRAGVIAPELGVPVSVPSNVKGGTTLDLEPFAQAIQTTPDLVCIDLAADGSELSIATGRPPSYYYEGRDGRQWLAAHVPQALPPTGFCPRAAAATVRLDAIAAAGTRFRRRRLIARARQYRAVDCSSTSLDAATTARLMVDLAGAGAPLVATALSGDVAELLGPDLAAAIEGCAVEVLADPRLRERHSVALRRLVHRHHSVYENVAALAAAHGHQFSASPSVSILMATNRPEMVMSAIEQMSVQLYPNVEILCGLHGFSLGVAARERVAAVAPHAQLISVGTDHDLGQVLALLSERASGDLVTKWDDDDWYTPEHLHDLVAAMRYSGAGVVGKAAEYVYLSSLDITIRRLPLGAERFSTTIAGGTLMLTRSTLQGIGGWPAGPRRVDRLLIAAVEAAGAPIYRLHGVGYLLRRDSSNGNHTWRAGDEYFLTQAVEQRAGLDLQFAGVVP